VKTVYQLKKIWKWLFLISAFCITLITLFYSNTLIKELKQEEVKKVHLWANAYEQFNQIEEGKSIEFLLEIIQSNSTIPIIVYNVFDKRVESVLNIDKEDQTAEKLKSIMKKMEAEYKPISIKGFKGIGDNEMEAKIYYTNSFLLTKLKIYPFILITTLGFFIVLAYWAFSTSRKSEQSLVWAGMARETAHQIGTPLSSLLGWYELLKVYDIPEDHLDEIAKDLNRLQVITERFSKIGAEPGLQVENVVPVVRNSYQYLRRRASQRIEFSFHTDQEKIFTSLNKELLSWVVENIVRNSIDSISGEGKIALHLFEKGKRIYIDFTDTGKGIKPNNFKTIFQPGYTTKTRGWGLGLSLVKRIINIYHKGDVYVLKSDINQGTTIRVMLPKKESKK
jgi:hypothetical protein